ncbi:unnamed protein product, partial [Acidithrix sp. C25]
VQIMGVKLALAVDQPDERYPALGLLIAIAESTRDKDG